MSLSTLTDAWENSPYEGSALLVHLAIADVVNSDNDYQLWMVREKIAAKARVSVPTVTRVRAQMVADGWLVPAGDARRGRGQASEYRYAIGGKAAQVEPLSEPLVDHQTGVSGSSDGSSPLSQPKEPNAAKDAVREVYDAWVVSTGRVRTVLDDKRRRLIRARLHEHPVADLVDAARGWERSEFHRGRNDRRKVYNDLELIYRDAHHVEMFRDYARAPAQPAREFWEVAEGR